MDLLFNRINEWHVDAFPGCTIDLIMDKVSEEYEELVEAVDHGNMAEISDEIADCFIVLVSASRILGIDIKKSVSDKFERVKRKYPTK